jgi:hypothetical protein
MTDLSAAAGVAYAGANIREENMTRTAQLTRCSIIALIGLAGVNFAGIPARAEEPYKADLDALRQSLMKYQDYKTAVRELYLSTVGCVYYSGEKIPGHMEYPKGAMGIHFVNLTVTGPKPDSMRPNVLIYEPVGRDLRLIAVEWLVPLAGAKERPTLFGQPFQGPMEGHFPLIPKEFTHYDLHAWLFKNNPLGMFSPTNPDVKCDGYDYSLLEEPTKMVHEP